MAAEVRFKLGEGRISGALSALLGLSALGGVLCFRHPEWFTSVELREQYDPAVLREVLFWGLVVGSLSGAINFVFEKGRVAAILGLAACALAVALGGAGVDTSGAPAHRLSLGLDWLILGLLVSALVFIPLEKLFGLRRDQPILRRQWVTDLQYFAVNSLFFSYIVLITTNAVPVTMGWAVSDSVQQTVRAWPGWVQFVVAVFCADFAQYWVHRSYHRWLWPVHAVHHSAPAMDWLAGSRLHVIEVLATRALVFGVLFLIGFSEPVVQAYVVLVGAQAVFAHTNVGIEFGWLSYVLVTPRYHHWHHATDRAAADTNFAVHLPVIDWMFGTLRLPPKGEWPESYGVMGPPVPDGLLRQAVYPFRRRD